MFVIYLAGLALLLGLLAVVVFASLDLLHAKGADGSLREEDGNEAILRIEAMIEELTGALGLKKEGSEREGASSFHVYSDPRPLTGGRFVFLLAEKATQEERRRLKERVKAEGGLKGVLVSVQELKPQGEVELDQVLMEQLDTKAVEKLLKSLRRPDPRPPDPLHEPPCHEAEPGGSPS